MTEFFHELRCNSGRQGVVTLPYEGRSTVERDDVGIVPYEAMTRNVAHNTADAKCIPAASGKRGPA